MKIVIETTPQVWAMIKEGQIPVYACAYAYDVYSYAKYKVIKAKREDKNRADDALDDIKAEIEQDAFEDVNGSKYIFVNRVNQIIDKYKESEE